MKKFLIVFAILIIRKFVFAAGDIVVYLNEHQGLPTDAHLDRLTHIALFSIIPGADGTVPLKPGGNGTWSDDISDMVNRAHNKNVKVVIVISGGSDKFSQNVQVTNRETFTDNIVNLVNQYNFDGVDIDWEFPSGTQQIDDFEKFLVLLKQKLGTKRLSFAIGLKYSPSSFQNNTYAAIDALHIMTYDMEVEVSSGVYDHHAGMEKTKNLINSFVISGRISKEKIFYGVPFYGKSQTNNKDTKTYADIIKGKESTLSQQDFDGTYYYDGVLQVKEKTKYAYDKGIGGIMIWEMGQDVAATSQYSLLNAIWQQTQELKPAQISVTYNAGGTVKNGNSTVASGKQIDVQKGNDLTLTFTANNEYFISDVKINGVSNSAAITSGTYTFGNVNADANIEVIFVKNIVEYYISVKHSAGGTIKNGNSTVNSGTQINVQKDSSLTLTFIQDSGYYISDVKVNSTSNDTAKTSGTYTFGSVNANANIEVTFTKDSVTPPVGPDIADGTWGNSAWVGVSDEGKNGSTLNITKQGNPLTTTWKLGPEPQGENVPYDDYPYVGIAFFNGDWSQVTQIEIKYSVNQPTYIALNSKNGHEYYVELQIGNNKTMTITPSQFKKFEWDEGEHSLLLPEVKGLSLNAFYSYGSQTNLTVTSIIVSGLTDKTPPITIAQNKHITISKVGISVANGNINLSFPENVNNANITLFDVRGKILLERNVALSTNFVSVALPKSILRNQAVLLQVKTNSGSNITKRILIK